MTLVLNPMCLLFPFVSYCGNNNLPPSADVPVDGFKALGNLPKLVAAYGSSSCPLYRCFNSTRTRYNAQTRETSYMWALQGPPTLLRKTATFDIKFGSTQDTATFTIDGDTCHTYEASYDYTDYKSCLVLGFQYYLDKLCILLVDESVLNAIPKVCMDGFNKACGINSTSTSTSC